MLGAKEIADDPEAVKKLTDFYWELEKGSGAVPVLLPWLPTPAKKKVELSSFTTARFIAVIFNAS